MKKSGDRRSVHNILKGSVFTLHMSGVLFHVNLRRSRFSVHFLLEEKCFGFMWPFCLFKFVLRSDAFTSARPGLTRGEPVSNKKTMLTYQWGACVLLWFDFKQGFSGSENANSMWCYMRT